MFVNKRRGKSVAILVLRVLGFLCYASHPNSIGNIASSEFDGVKNVIRFSGVNEKVTCCTFFFFFWLLFIGDKFFHYLFEN